MSAIRLTAVRMPQGYVLVLSVADGIMGFSAPDLPLRVQVGVNVLATLRISLCKYL